MSSSQRTGNARPPCRAPPGPGVGSGVLCSATTPPRSSDAIARLDTREKTVKSATLGVLPPIQTLKVVLLAPPHV